MNDSFDSAIPAKDFNKLHRRSATDGMKVERIQPHAIEAEQGVLGCIMLSPSDCMPECQMRLKSTPEAFYDLRHQSIWECLVEMADAREAIDVITLQQRLRDKGQLEGVGGLEFLLSLPDKVPSSANIAYYTDIVVEKHLMRDMIRACNKIVSKIYDWSGDVNELLDSAEREVLAVRPTSSNEIKPIKQLVHDSICHIEEVWNRQGQIGGLPYGLIDLDKATDGLHPQEMIIIAAFPSAGKTSLAMNIAENIVLNHHESVGVFSLEMSAMQLVTRFICSHARVNLRNLRNGFMAERDFPKLTSAAAKVSNAKLFIDDTSDMSIYTLRAKARRMVQQHKCKLFIVDYLQLLNASGGPRKWSSREEEVTAVSNGLKNMAKELNVPVIILSQLTKLPGGETRLRGSDSVLQDADTVIKLEKPESDEGYDQESELVNAVIKKQRMGERDGVIPLTFLKPFTRFESAAKISQEDVPQTNPYPNSNPRRRDE